MPREATYPDSQTVQILSDTEKKGIGIYYTDFSFLCNTSPHIYGHSGTELRRQFQKKRGRLLCLKPSSLKKKLDLADIKPHRLTLQRMKELEEEEKKGKEDETTDDKEEEEEEEEEDNNNDNENKKEGKKIEKKSKLRPVQSLSVIFLTLTMF
jgi:hypothetical protein